MEKKEERREDLLDRLNCVRKEQAGVCTSTCRSVVYSLMAASWAFWINDGSHNDGILFLVFMLGCLYLAIETGLCYYVSKQADKSYNSARILIIPTDKIENKMERISNITFRKLIFQMIYCMSMVVLFGDYVFKN